VSLTLTQIQPYWATKSSLTGLIPSNNVWIDYAGDGATMPYAIIEQIGLPDVQNTFGPGYIQITRFNIAVWASTYASVDQITLAVIAAFKNSRTITPQTMVNLLNDIVPAMDKGNADVGKTTWEIWEALQG
jgi:hypothetical protein